MRVDHRLRKVWIPVARLAQKQSHSSPVNRVHSKIKHTSSHSSQVAIAPTYGASLLNSLYISWKRGDVLFIYRKLTFINIYINTKKKTKGTKPPTVHVVLVPGTICRDISAYRVFQIIHSGLCWVLSFLLLCFSFGISLLLWKKKVMCKNQAMFFLLTCFPWFTFAVLLPEEREGGERWGERKRRRD